MAPFKPLKGHKKAFKPKRNYKKKTIALPQQIKNIVNKIVAHKEETKCQSYAIPSTGLQVYAFGNLLEFNATQVLGLITQGAAEGQRIGNRIDVTSFVIRGFVGLTTAIVSNIYVKIVALRLKAQVSSPNGNYNVLYQNGNSTLAPSGTLSDMMRDFNKDFFTIYQSKQFLLGSNDAVTSVMPYNNSKGTAMFKFDLSKHIKKVVWNDSTSLPTNCGMYLAFIPCNADGSIITLAQVSPYYTTCEVEMKYKDA